MTEDKSSSRRRGMADNGMWGSVYGMAFIGAVVYYISNAATFWAGVLGFFKAVVWPAVLMYKLMEFLKM